MSCNAGISDLTFLLSWSKSLSFFLIAGSFSLLCRPVNVSWNLLTSLFAYKSVIIQSS